MKKIIYILASLSLLWSCKDEEKPVAEFDYYVVRGGSDTLWNVNPLYANEQVTFVNRGEGDYFVVYTGSAESNYDTRTLPTDTLIQEANKVSQKGVGYTLAKSRGVYTASYAYQDKGDFNVVYVASLVTRKDGKLMTETNDKVTITVRDTVAFMSNISLKKPGVKSRAVVNSSSIVIYVPYGTSQTELASATLKFQAGKAKVYRDDNLVVMGFAEYEDKGLNLSNGKIVTYRLVAPDGNENIVTVEVKFDQKVLKEGNDLLSATIAKVKYAPVADALTIVYPKGKTSEAVAFVVSPGASILVDNKDLKGAAKVSDFSSKGEIVVTSEKGVAKKYSYVLKEDAVAVTPLAFIGSNGATGFLVSSTGPGALSVYLSTTIDASKLIPSFPQSMYTTISKVGTDNKLVVYKNGVDTVDFTNPVKFVFQNGTDSLAYEFTVKQ